jgi:hypothetical protein
MIRKERETTATSPSGISFLFLPLLALEKLTRE